MAPAARLVWAGSGLTVGNDSQGRRSRRRQSLLSRRTFDHVELGTTERSITRKMLENAYRAVAAANPNSD